MKKNTLNYADVSVIIPYFNSENTIKRCLDSVINQSLPVREVIIVDDGSTNKLWLPDFLKKYNCNRIKLIQQENKGAASARNLAISYSTSKYIAFLDSDDTWHKEKIKIQYEYMQKNDIFLSAHGYLSNSQNYDSHFNKPKTKKIKKILFIKGSLFNTPTVMVKAKYFLPFDTRLQCSEDYKCWIENYSNGTYAYICTNLANGFKTPIGESGLSGNIPKMHKEYKKALKLLLKEKSISVIYYLTAIFIEKIKYPIRYLIFSK
ncbi:glycosyltransferase family 2 protein [Comamonas kerstersii]|uniref:glycosyltransferase family 2 protein n=1 Tax=Comamonas kerstersii TaxID=225992 RepID=UPI00345D5183